MLACLLAMLLPLSHEPPQVGGQVKAPVTQSSEAPAVRNQFTNQRPIFGPDDPTPRYQLHPAVIDSQPATTPAIVEDPEEIDEDSESDSFLASAWPYALTVVVLVGWCVAQSRLKRAPNFKHHVIPERKQNETGPKLKGHFKVSKRFQQSDGNEKNNEIDMVGETEVDSQLDSDDPPLTGQFKVATPSPKALGGDEETSSVETIDSDDPPLTGRFKVATRFQKPKQEEPETSSPELTNSGDHRLVEAQSETQQHGDRPADDEFELDFGDSAFDSEMLSEEQRAKILEAAEILAAVGKRKNGGNGQQSK